jgi:replicative DNA helicase
VFEIYKTTLQLIKHKERYNKLRGIINQTVIDADVKKLLTCVDQYWRNYPGHDRVNPDTLLAELGLKYQDMAEADKQMYAGMIDVMMQEPDEDTAKGFIRSIRTLDFADRLEKAYEAFHSGADMDLFDTVKHLGETFEADISRYESVDYVRDSIIEIIRDAEHGTRLPWHLTGLNGAMPTCRTGEQIIFAARPGKGKTSFCAAQAVHVASCTPDDRPVVWFNNESYGTKIKGTLYRAALGRTFNEIVELGGEAAQEMYEEATGGRDRIRIFDIHGRDYRFLEGLIAKHKPAVIFWDMLDNVHGFGEAQRTDLRLESLYQWAREQSVIHDFLSIPTSQISVEGEGLAWCDQSMLKDSKTAKQGACDAIIMMGSVSKKNQLDSRFLYIPKTKYAPSKGFRADCAQEIVFDGARCKFTEAMAEEAPNA